MVGWARVAAVVVAMAACRGRAKPASDDVQAQLEALGYVAEGGAAPAVTGLVTHDPTRAHRGTNLVVSAHAYEATLLDMDGTLLHTWRLPSDQEPVKAPRMEGFRRAMLLPDGGLLAVLSGSWLYRLDVSGRVVWKSTRYYHHDAHIEADGTIHVLARRTVALPRLGGASVFEDYIQVFDADGKPLRDVSVLAPLATVLRPQLMARARDRVLDVLHTNSVQLLDGRAAAVNPAFVEGGYLISARGLDLIAVIDPRDGSVPWFQQGPWKAQHDPEITPTSTMLLFDNHPPGPSRVVEVGLNDLAERWSWAGGQGRSFYTECCGTAARLPNGNTLVVVTDEGIAVEVAPDGAVVWEWHSPHTASGMLGRVARLMDVVRGPPREAFTWLQ